MEGAKSDHQTVMHAILADKQTPGIHNCSISESHSRIDWVGSVFWQVLSFNVVLLITEPNWQRSLVLGLSCSISACDSLWMF